MSNLYIGSSNSKAEKQHFYNSIKMRFTLQYSHFMDGTYKPDSKLKVTH